MVEKLRLSKGRYIQSQAIHHAGTFPQTAPPHRPCSQYRQYRLKKKLLPRQPCPSGGHNLEADFSWARAADSSCQVSESDSSCWDRLKLLLLAQPGIWQHSTMISCSWHWQIWQLSHCSCCQLPDSTTCVQDSVRQGKGEEGPWTRSRTSWHSKHLGRCCICVVQLIRQHLHILWAKLPASIEILNEANLNALKWE